MNRLSVSLLGVFLLVPSFALPAGAQSDAAIAPASLTPPASAAPSSAPSARWFTTGDVLQVQRDTLDGVELQTIRVHLDDSPQSRNTTDRNVTIVVPMTGPGSFVLEPEQRVVVAVEEDANGTLRATVVDRTHSGLWIALLLGIALIIILGRKTGFATVATIVLSMLLLQFFAAPLVLRGVAPVVVALLTALVFAGLVAIVVFHWTRAALATVIGSFVSILFTALLAWGFFSIANLADLRSPLVASLLEHTDLPLDTLALSLAILVATGAIPHCATRITATIFLERRQHPDRGLHVLLDTGLTHGRRVLPSIAETTIWAILGLGFPLLVHAGATVSVLRATLFGDVALLLVLPVTVIASVALAIPVVTVAAAVLATRDRA